MAWREAQTSPRIPSSQSLVQSKAPTLFNSVRAERAEEAAGAKQEAGRGRFTVEGKKASPRQRSAGEAAGADGEAAETYPEGLAEKFMRRLHSTTDRQGR